MAKYTKRDLTALPWPAISRVPSCTSAHLTPETWVLLSAVMSPAKKKSAKKALNLGWLQELSFAKGAAKAKSAFEKEFPAATESLYRLYRSGDGQPVHRTDAEARDGISYDTYSPPAFWETPYQLLRLRLEQVNQREFLFHSGEELLIPLTGEIKYHFFWKDPKTGASSPKRDVTDALKPGSIIKINPKLPHHAWASVKKGATAWMITRPTSNIGTSIYLNTPLDAPDLHPTPRRVKEADLKKPGQYALIAWGLAEKIRLQRFRSNLRIAQVAAHCGIDASHLSRIENADTNVSLETLLRIGKFLRIDLDRLMAPEPWGYEIEKLALQQSKGAPIFQELLTEPVGPRESFQPSHFLHAVYWELQEGQQVPTPKPSGAKYKHPSSWILLSGRIIMDVRTNTGSIAELVEKDSVLHLREDPPQNIHALQDSKMVQIIYSGECFCKKVV
jgi:transcriptional regulator with XRE-family HTH domain